MSEDLGFTGSISFNKAYEDAPNPGLCIAQAGLIGLPLNFREAEIIKMRAAQAHFESAQVQESAPNTYDQMEDSWKIDPTLVSSLSLSMTLSRDDGLCPRRILQIVFENPLWATWVNRIVQEACAALGVDTTSMKPAYKLTGLVLHGPGHQCVLCS